MTNFLGLCGLGQLICSSSEVICESVNLLFFWWHSLDRRSAHFQTHYLHTTRQIQEEISMRNMHVPTGDRTEVSIIRAIEHIICLRLRCHGHRLI